MLNPVGTETKLASMTVLPLKNPNNMTKNEDEDENWVQNLDCIATNAYRFVTRTRLELQRLRGKNLLR